MLIVLYKIIKFNHKMQMKDENNSNCRKVKKN